MGLFYTVRTDAQDGNYFTVYRANYLGFWALIVLILLIAIPATAATYGAYHFTLTTAVLVIVFTGALIVFATVLLYETRPLLTTTGPGERLEKGGWMISRSNPKEVWIKGLLD